MFFVVGIVTNEELSLSTSEFDDSSLSSHEKRLKIKFGIKIHILYKLKRLVTL
jgi:hypothetical protein